MSWHFSQALVEAYSAENCSDGEQSVQSKLKSMPEMFLFKGKTTAVSNRSRYGMIYEPLTERDGEVLLTSFLEAFRARTYPAQAKAQELQGSDQDFGLKCRGLLARLDQDTALWKTPQCSLFGDLELSLQTFPRWGIMQDGELWGRVMSDYLIKERDCGLLLPTPTVADQRGKRTEKSRSQYSDMRLWWRDNVGGWINPNHSELLMSFPIGWSDLQALETHKFQQWLKQFGSYYLD